MADRYLVTGGGAREHALVWALRQADSKAEICCLPGNAGIAQIAECLPVAADDVRGIMEQVMRIRPDVTIAGPEAGLVLGLGDQVRAAGFGFVGPSKKAAQLEGKKAWANWLMNQARVPKPHTVVFQDPVRAIAYALKQGPLNIVLKADGLCGGKGVILPENEEEAKDAVERMLSGQLFGKAGERILVQERLSGREASVIAVTDGTKIVLLPSAQDYKRRFDSDEGPNTGGMGARTPNPWLTSSMGEEVVERIIKPILKGLKKRLHIVYNGFLYAGLMITEEGPKVLEFNVRLGDPEASVMLPLWTGNASFAQLMQATAHGDLMSIQAYPQQGCAVCGVLISAGYPGSYNTGYVIAGLDEAARMESVLVFHAGTKQGKDEQILTAGGRVLEVVGVGPINDLAHDRMYAAANCIQFQGRAMRSDIAAR